MKQESDEKFDKFFIPLGKTKLYLEQITKKCNSTQLRKNSLILADAATIEKIIAEANSLQTVEWQLTDFHDKQSKTIKGSNLNKIDTKYKIYTCCRCDNKNHKSDSSSCPAINADCIKCSHYQKNCRTRAN